LTSSIQKVIRLKEDGTAMSESKHILMLLSNPFRPDPRVHREAKCLIGAGYDVTILCWDRDQKHPAEETIDGIHIIRLGPASGWGDSRNFVKTLPKFWKNLRKTASGLDFDIVHAHDLDTLSPGLKLAARKKVPIIYDSHELYHEMAGENLSKFLVKFLARYEKHMVRKLPMMITVNQPLADIFLGYGAKDVGVIMNCQPDANVNISEVGSIKKELSPEEKPIVLYIGVLEPNRLLLELAANHARGKEDFILVIGGFGSLEGELKNIAYESHGRVKFIGQVKPSDVPKYNQAASVLLAVYDPALKNNRIGAPNKLFESMIASRPIVVSKDTYAASVVEETGCGLSVDYNGGHALTAASQLLDDKKLYEKCAMAGRSAYEEKYNWPLMERRLLDIYSKLLSSSD